ncbi:MAG: ATP synthase subunit I [Gammaproteobacteria bacterium]|nr:ATP synthase subunit I [Gammaproteobacteria bacterium]MBU1645509.1 ATP synthase subunit I [Gammaproteobacteria bacterium]MBU1973689.1 ATP synthase subunit I [Gammaproteobacteria bacterium]
MHPHVRPQVRWILSRQLLLTFGVAVLAGMAGGAVAALAALVGGGIGALAGAAYVWRAMRRGEGEPGELYRAQMLGEGYKFAVTLGLFALVFVSWRNVPALPLFLAYILTFGVYWVALLKKR